MYVTNYMAGIYRQLLNLLFDKEEKSERTLKSLPIKMKSKFSILNTPSFKIGAFNIEKLSSLFGNDRVDKSMNARL